MSAHLSDAIARRNCPVELPRDASVHESRRGTEMAQGDDFRRK
jgi:hypothetical protein